MNTNNLSFINKSAFNGLAPPLSKPFLRDLKGQLFEFVWEHRIYCNWNIVKKKKLKNAFEQNPNTKVNNSNCAIPLHQINLIHVWVIEVEYI